MTQRAYKPAGPAAEITVTALLAEWPKAAEVFLRRRMPCVGCEMSDFDTLADVARTYNVDLGRFLDELQTIVQGAGPEDQA